MKMKRSCSVPLFTALLASGAFTASCANDVELARTDERTGSVPPAKSNEPTGTAPAAFVPPPCPDPPPQHLPARTVYGLDNNDVLIRFQADAPNAVETIGPVTLPFTTNLVGIDFEPATGLLYGFGIGTTSGYFAFLIDRWTTMATFMYAAVSTPNLAPNSTSWGVDFHPVTGEFVSPTTTGLVFSLEPGGASGNGVSFAAGDPNAGRIPRIAGLAYTNSVSPKPLATTPYIIDYELDVLAMGSINAEGDYSLTTVGPLGIDAQALVGFDISGGTGGGGTFPSGRAIPIVTTPSDALAAFVVQGSAQSGLYRINLQTGAATLIGSINHPVPLKGMAIDL